MKKTLVKGLVSASVLAAPAVAVADGHNKFEIYGIVEARAIDRDMSDFDTHVSTARVGLKGVNDLPNSSSMDLRWQLEFNLPANASNATSGSDDGDVALRKANVSLQGNFGELILGRQNHIGADALVIDQFKNDSGAYVVGPYRIGNALGYVSPSMGGAKLYLQVAADADADNEDNDLDAIAYGFQYSNDTISATLAHYEVESTYPSGEVDLNSLGVSASFANFGVFATYQDEGASDKQVVGLGGSYSANNWTYKLGTLSFEEGVGNTEGTANYLLANYGFGNGVNGYVQYVDYDSAAEAAGKGDAITVGVAASVSKVFEY